MKEIKLPSGALLKINQAPFTDAKALLQALLEEIKAIKIETKTEMASLYKDIFCAGISSPKIEAALWKCLKRCTYNSKGADLKIEENTFEPIEAREDYLAVCMGVAKENIDPFTKSLSAEYAQFFQGILSARQ